MAAKPTKLATKEEVADLASIIKLLKGLGFRFPYPLDSFHKVSAWKRKEFETVRQAEWEQGYVAAVANIIRTHGNDVIARDVLNAGGRINLAKANQEHVVVLKRAKVI